ncbi:MAG TPA: hypothetical protein VKA09_08815 [Nitrososphaeraceae archaeon]|nr:hypothetical protein [Nitrososphaeraceae archaeon]
MDSALGTALHILRSLNEGQSKYEIIQHMDNNEKLVTVWIQYLKAIGWLREDTPRNLLATENGKLWIQRYEKAIPSNLNTNRLANILNRQRS